VPNGWGPGLPRATICAGTGDHVEAVVEVPTARAGGQVARNNRGHRIKKNLGHFAAIDAVTGVAAITTVATQVAPF
jgi:hypothetical protein